jgi:hypothetical protein
MTTPLRIMVSPNIGTGGDQIRPPMTMELAPDRRKGPVRRLRVVILIDQPIGHEPAQLILDTTWVHQQMTPIRRRNTILSTTWVP